MKLIQWRMRSEIGSLYLIASENGLSGIFFRKQDAPMAESLAGAGTQIRILRSAARQLKEYLAGKRKKFTLPLDARGTPFQRKVWSELARIPYGKTRSYKDIASRIRNAKAARAVGAANGQNPLCILVPCHRVISHDGTIGGYSGGPGIKKKLLRLEQSCIIHG